MHLAVVNSDDKHMDTISLKNITERKGWAAFAIAMSFCAMGTDMLRNVMYDVIQIGKVE